MQASSSTARPAPEFHFLDYWRIIRIRKMVILAVWLLVVITTVAVTLVLKPTYDSTITIEIQKDIPDIGPIGVQQDRNDYDPYFMATEFSKIQSDSVLWPVVKTNNFIPTWSQRLGLRDGELLSPQEAVEYLRRNLEVQQSRNTKLVEISVYSPVKEEAADLANLIADSYKEFRQKSRKEPKENAIEVLKKQLEVQELRVATLQTNVDNLRVELNIPDTVNSPTAAYSVSTERERLSTLLGALQQARSDLVYYESKLDALQSLETKDLRLLRDAILTVMPGEQILPLRLDDLDKVEQRLASLRTEYAADYPEVQSSMALQQVLQTQVSNRIDGLLQGLRANVSAFKARYVLVSNQVEEAKVAVAKEASKFSQYFELKRELENQM
ncbi:MAG: hypothetical protein KDM81_02655, partial [Verrucomicrobiae bacterium]|nr:hypothetical protein [Verrucomicrobiae bacterium]